MITIESDCPLQIYKLFRTTKLVKIQVLIQMWFFIVYSSNFHTHYNAVVFNRFWPICRYRGWLVIYLVAADGCCWPAPISGMHICMLMLCLFVLRLNSRGQIQPADEWLYTNSPDHRQLEIVSRRESITIETAPRTLMVFVYYTNEIV